MQRKKYHKGSSKTDGLIIDYYVCGYDEVNEFTGCYEWGIRVEKKAPVEEAEEIKNISPDFNKVCDIADILRKNSVTPIGLKYALEDML